MAEASEGEAAVRLQYAFDIKGRIRLYLHQLDITQLRVDGIVCPVSEQLKPVEAVSLRIAHAAGKGLAKECATIMKGRQRRWRRWQKSEVVCTQAHNLPCKRVLLVQRQPWPSTAIERRTCLTDLRQTLSEVYKTAAELDVMSLAIPFGDGSFALPPEHIATEIYLSLDTFSGDLPGIAELHIVDTEGDLLIQLLKKLQNNDVFIRKMDEDMTAEELGNKITECSPYEHLPVPQPRNHTSEFHTIDALEGRRHQTTPNEQPLSSKSKQHYSQGEHMTSTRHSHSAFQDLREPAPFTKTSTPSHPQHCMTGEIYEGEGDQGNDKYKHHDSISQDPLSTKFKPKPKPKPKPRSTKTPLPQDHQSNHSSPDDHNKFNNSKPSKASLDKEVQTVNGKDTNDLIAEPCVRSPGRSNSTQNQSQEMQFSPNTFASRSPSGFQASGFHISNILEIFIHQYDITSMCVDAIVSPANPYLKPGSGLSKVIADAAGPDFVCECQRTAGGKALRYSSVKSTTAGRLPCNLVYHAVGPFWSEGASNIDDYDKTLRCLEQTFHNIFQEAIQGNISSIAWSSVSSGIHGIPTEYAIAEMWKAMTYMLLNSGSLREIHLVDLDQHNLRVMEQEFKKVSTTMATALDEEHIYRRISAVSVSNDREYFGAQESPSRQVGGGAGFQEVEDDCGEKKDLGISGDDFGIDGEDEDADDMAGAVAAHVAPRRSVTIASIEEARCTTDVLNHIRLREGTDPVVPSLTEILELELNFSRQDALGSGSFGCVFRGIWLGTNVAIKEIPYKRQRQGTTDYVKTELNIHASLRHPNIVQIMGFSLTRSSFLVVNELIEGANLEDCIFNAGSAFHIPEERKLPIMKDISRAVAYLHSKLPPVVHQDIKPSNVLVSHSNYQAKLGDLGVSRLRTFDTRTCRGQGQSLAGTWLYMAPEALVGVKSSCASDMWSLACTFLELITENDVWDINEPDVYEKLKREVTRKNLPPRTSVLRPVLLHKCLSYDSSQRPTALDVIEILSRMSELQTICAATTPI